MAGDWDAPTACALLAGGLFRAELPIITGYPIGHRSFGAFAFLRITEALETRLVVVVAHETFPRDADASQTAVVLGAE